MVIKTDVSSLFKESVEFDDEVDIYARVSSEDQQERETIENQIEFAIKYCDLHKLKINMWYKDDGISGTIPLEERPDGKRLVENAKAGKAKTILIYNMKRLSRNARITLNAVHALDQCGVQIKSMTEPFDTTTAHGRFALTILAGVAEYDRETTLETMWHGANRAARKGKWLGGIVPFGYKVNEERYLEINEDPIPGKEDFTEVGIIQLMYRMIAIQKSTTVMVADYFNALSIPPSYIKNGRKIKKGKRKVSTAGIWTPSRIGNMIRNTTYKGLHIYGKRSNKERELIERAVPAIVSEETWAAAQQTLKDNQLESMKNSKRQYLLRGLIKCGTCGLTYHGTAFSGPKKLPRAYYICGGKTAYRGPLQGKCTSKNISAEALEEQVWNECVAFINNPGDALEELEEGLKEKISVKETLESEKLITIKVIREKEDSKQSVLNLLRKRLITNEDVEKQLEAIANEKLELEIRVRELDELIKTDAISAGHFKSAESLLLELKQKLEVYSSFEDRRYIVRALVREITIETSTFGDNGNKPKLFAKVKYAFSKVKVITRTPVLAAIMVRNQRQMLVPAVLQRLSNIGPKFQDHSLIASIFTWKSLSQATRN